MDSKRLLRWIVYFRRGHSSWFAMLLSFLNFIVIQYRLLIEQIPFLRNMFSSLTVFTLLFIAVYVPTATLFGWLDYKRLTKPRELEADYYFTHPSYKEREYYFPFFIYTLKTLKKLLEKHGVKDPEIDYLIKKIEKFMSEPR